MAEALEVSKNALGAQFHEKVSSYGECHVQPVLISVAIAAITSYGVTS
jgi:hypothetical protein